MQSDNQNNIKVKHYHIQIDALKFTCQQSAHGTHLYNIDELLIDTFDVVKSYSNHKNEK